MALKADREKLQAKIKDLEEAGGGGGAGGTAPPDAKMQEDFEKLKKMVGVLYPASLTASLTRGLTQSPHGPL